MKALKALKPLTEMRPLLPKELPGSALPPEVSDNPEDAARADHIVMMRSLRDQQQAANEMANDSAYWFGVYFQSFEQKEQFIAAMKLTTGGQFVDGLELAERCNVSVTARTVKYKTNTLDKKCAELAR